MKKSTKALGALFGAALFGAASAYAQPASLTLSGDQVAQNYATLGSSLQGKLEQQLNSSGKRLLKGAALNYGARSGATAPRFFDDSNYNKTHVALDTLDEVGTLQGPYADNGPWDQVSSNVTLTDKQLSIFPKWTTASGFKTGKTYTLDVSDAEAAKFRSIYATLNPSAGQESMTPRGPFAPLPSVDETIGGYALADSTGRSLTATPGTFGPNAAMGPTGPVSVTGATGADARLAATGALSSAERADARRAEAIRARVELPARPAPAPRATTPAPTAAAVDDGSAGETVNFTIGQGKTKKSAWALRSGTEAEQAVFDYISNRNGHKFLSGDYSFTVADGRVTMNAGRTARWSGDSGLERRVSTPRSTPRTAPRRTVSSQVDWEGLQHFNYLRKPAKNEKPVLLEGATRGGSFTPIADADDKLTAIMRSLATPTEDRLLGYGLNSIAVSAEPIKVNGEPRTDRAIFKFTYTAGGQTKDLIKAVRAPSDGTFTWNGGSGLTINAERPAAPEPAPNRLGSEYTTLNQNIALVRARASRGDQVTIPVRGKEKDLFETFTKRYTLPGPVDENNEGTALSQLTRVDLSLGRYRTQRGIEDTPGTLPGYRLDTVAEANEMLARMLIDPVDQPEVGTPMLGGRGTPSGESPAGPSAVSQPPLMVYTLKDLFNDTNGNGSIDDAEKSMKNYTSFGRDLHRVLARSLHRDTRNNFKSGERHVISTLNETFAPMLPLNYSLADVMGAEGRSKVDDAVHDILSDGVNISEADRLASGLDLLGYNVSSTVELKKSVGRLQRDMHRHFKKYGLKSTAKFLNKRLNPVEIGKGLVNSWKNADSFSDYFLATLSTVTTVGPITGLELGSRVAGMKNFGHIANTGRGLVRAIEQGRPGTIAAEALDSYRILNWKKVEEPINGGGRGLEGGVIRRGPDIDTSTGSRGSW